MAYQYVYEEEDEIESSSHFSDNFPAHSNDQFVDQDENEFTLDQNLSGLVPSK